MSKQRIPITSFQAGELSEKLSGRFDVAAYNQGMSKLENWLPFSQGGITMRPGTRFMGGLSQSVEKERLQPFIITKEISYVLEFTEDFIYFWRDGVKVRSAGIAVSVETDYQTVELYELQFCQIGHSLLIAHRNHPVFELKWIGGDAFTGGNLAYDGETWAANTAYGAEEIIYSGGNLFFSEIGGTSGATAPVMVEEDTEIPDGTVTWRWLQKAPFRTANNYPGCIAYFNGRLWLASTITDPQKIWASKPFDYGNFCLFDVVSYTNREIKDAESYYFRGSANGKVLTVYTDPRPFVTVGQFITGQILDGVKQVPTEAVVASMTDTTITVTSAESLISGGQLYYTASWWPDPTVPVYEDKTTRTDVIGAGSAIELEINSDQNNRITFMAATRALVIGTLIDEWVIPNTVTAIDVQAQLQTRIGSDTKQGILFDSAIVFIQGDGKRVREYFFQADQESYQSPDLTFMADHVLESGVVEFDFMQNPEPTLLFIRADGVLSVLVYNKQHGTQAWCRYIIGDAVESVAVVPGLEGDDVYMIVRRGQNRYMERLDQPFFPYHLDSGVSLVRDSAESIDGNTVLWTGNGVTGLLWLSGNVTVTDGEHSAVVSVAAGAITIPATITGNAISIGKAFTATATTMRLTTMGDFGIMQGNFKRVVSAIFRLYRSYPFFTGKTPTFEQTEIIGPYTGDILVPLVSGWERDGMLTVYQDAPFPVTILGIIAETEQN